MKILLALLAIYNLHAHDRARYKFEGVLGNVAENIQNMNSNTQGFLPYNPVIVEIGAFEGTGTFSLSSMYPYGAIFAFEPHPTAYMHLVEKTHSLKNVSVIHSAASTWNGTATLYGNGPTASLLAQNAESQVDVPVVVLDDWCRQHSIDHIDFLLLRCRRFRMANRKELSPYSKRGHCHCHQNIHEPIPSFDPLLSLIEKAIGK